MRRRTFAVVTLAGGAVAAVAVVRHLRGASIGRRVPGGILIGDAGVYDAVSRLVFGSFFEGVAGDVAAVAPDGARVLEVGCGPGLLSIRLARKHGLAVTGMDLDPAMVERANANAAREGEGPRPAFSVGDAGSLEFPDGSFDLVVSTLSMHHWADPSAGLAEIARVLRPGGRALIWDLRPGLVPFHADLPDPVEHTWGTALQVASAERWRWPWGLHPTQRIELVRADGPPAAPGVAEGDGRQRR